MTARIRMLLLTLAFFSCNGIASEEGIIKQFIDGIALITLKAAWPTATYEGWTFESIKQLDNNHREICFKINAKSYWTDGDIWVEVIADVDSNFHLSNIKWGEYKAVFPPGTAISTLSELARNSNQSSISNSTNESNNTSWQPGSVNTRYEHVVASDTVNSWVPESGYKWINPNDSSDFRVVKKESDIDQAVNDIVIQHFAADSKCNIESVMQFYASTVYYERDDKSKDYIFKTKTAACNRYSEINYSIRNNDIQISDFIGSDNITYKVVEYKVDYDVISMYSNKEYTGVTGVKLTFRTDIYPPKIIAESHHKI